MESISALAAALRAIADNTVQEDLVLAPYTTFRIGGPARLAVFPASPEAAECALAVICQSDVPFAVMGRGSNLLVADAGFPGVILFTEGLRALSFSADTITAGAGVLLTTLASAAQRRGLAGLAFAYGIPGSVGGAVRMNAGAYGGTMADVVSTSRYYDLATGQTGEFSASAHEFAYRSSAYADGRRVVLSANLHLREGEKDVIHAEMQDYLARRRSKQPLELPSAGSVFKRPEGDYAGRLIELCGLKGKGIGGAQVSEKHAGFIVNRGGATADDVLGLIDLIRQTVSARTGVELECELCRLG